LDCWSHFKGDWEKVAGIANKKNGSERIFQRLTTVFNQLIENKIYNMFNSYIHVMGMLKGSFFNQYTVLCTHLTLLRLPVLAPFLKPQSHYFSKAEIFNILFLINDSTN